MPRSIAWRSLVSGIVALCTLLGLAIAVLLFSRMGALHGRTFRLYVTAGEAQDVLTGTDVWLDGQRVGIVKAITFRSPEAGIDSRLLLQLDVLESAREEIRTDSRVDLKSGGTIIGAPVVYLSAGTGQAHAVRNGDTLQLSKPTIDVEADVGRAEARIGATSGAVDSIVTNIGVIRAGMTTSASTMAAVLAAAGGDEPSSLAAGITRLATRVRRPSGTLGRALHDPDSVMVLARRAIAETDTVRALLSSRADSIGRFRHDSTLPRAVEQLRTALAAIQAQSRENDGTIGRVVGDRSLRAAVDSALTEMNALAADMKAHPLRYIQLF